MSSDPLAKPMTRTASLPPTNRLAWFAIWSLRSAIVAVMAGSASALFVHALDQATALRETHRWLLWGLPAAGAAVGWVYLRFGASVQGGNRRLFDEIQRPLAVVPLRMAPLILSGTLVSHLCGASVGREGTAVQMGGCLADQLSRPMRLSDKERPTLLMAGVAAGFASVFGTPVAGVLFALEVRSGGRLRFEALYPSLLAALLADQVGRAWGIQHTHYPVEVSALPWMQSLPLMLLAGLAFGLTARAFLTMTERLGDWLAGWLPSLPLRALTVGAILAALAWWLPVDRYLGLGVPTILQAFSEPVPVHDFAAKAALTAAAIASGFKGGEVTPLFFIGATLGNALAPTLGLPIGLLAAVGFVAVFAAAARAPIACTVMAFELFGAQAGLHAGLGCATACLVSGRVGLYGPRARAPS